MRSNYGQLNVKTRTRIEGSPRGFAQCPVLLKTSTNDLGDGLESVLIRSLTDSELRVTTNRWEDEQNSK